MDTCQPPKRYIRIRGSKVFYQTDGQGEPLLLLHGGFGTIEDFSSQIPELSKYFKVVAFERPGHGHSADTKDPFHFGTMSDHTIGLIEALELGPTNLIVWSDRATIAFLVSILRPDLVNR